MRLYFRGRPNQHSLCGHAKFDNNVLQMYCFQILLSVLIVGKRGKNTADDGDSDGDCRISEGCSTNLLTCFTRLGYFIKEKLERGNKKQKKTGRDYNKQKSNVMQCSAPIQESKVMRQWQKNKKLTLPQREPKTK